MVCLLAGPWVQLSVSAGNGWLHNALRHHWLMPISCHFRDCKAPLVTSLTHVSGAITSVQTFYLYLAAGVYVLYEGLNQHVFWRTFNWLFLAKRFTFNCTTSLAYRRDCREARCRPVSVQSIMEMWATYNDDANARKHRKLDVGFRWEVESGGRYGAPARD